MLLKITLLLISPNNKATFFSSPPSQLPSVALLHFDALAQYFLISPIRFRNSEGNSQPSSTPKNQYHSRSILRPPLIKRADDRATSGSILCEEISAHSHCSFHFSLFTFSIEFQMRSAV